MKASREVSREVFNHLAKYGFPVEAETDVIESRDFDGSVIKSPGRTSYYAPWWLARLVAEIGVDALAPPDMYAAALITAWRLGGDEAAEALLDET